MEKFSGLVEKNSFFMYDLCFQDGVSHYFFVLVFEVPQARSLRLQKCLYINITFLK